ncbi:hypothetical protein KVV02_005748 [Mortierella alpina]|uniref:DNA repair protein REV1 n=1 Tax=Mortierella alpina TaxID=64518 RepID=A0A9P8D0H7_MORAP|nr:hypothetical protein KVV02_005748 [Mortierella alpina]
MEPEQEEDPYAAIQYGDFASYFRHKKQKLQIQQDEIAALAAPDTAQIFEGVIVYVNGYTDPPIHGGEFRQYLSKSKITHIIASNLTQAKMKEFRNYKVAKPEWVVESVRANRLLPWHNYSTLRIPTSFAKFGVGSSAPSSPGSTPAPPAAGAQAGAGAAALAPLGKRTLSVMEDRDSITESTRDETPIAGEALETAAPELHSGHLHGESDAVIPLLRSDSALWDDSVLRELVASDEEPYDEAPITQESDEAPITQESDDSFFNNLELDMDEFEYQPSPPVEAKTHSTDEIGQEEPPENQDPGEQVQLGLVSDTFAQVQQTPVVIQRPFNPFARVAMPPPIARINDDGTKDVSHASTGANGDEQEDRHPTLIELSVPWNRMNSSVMPGFVEKFYQSSRLHYLSTWKAKLREATAAIHNDRPVILNKDKNKTIMHIDFDCFFASVATRDKPELQNQPIAVAHGSGGSATSNGEIASCNYLARNYGVKNGMHLRSARALCPNIVVVPYEFQEYEDISLAFYNILLGYADELQAVSVDEALVDVSSRCTSLWDEEAGSQGAHVPDGDTSRIAPESFAQKVRDEIFSATGCHASVGIGPNILLAKLSTKRAKPHGQYIWPSAPGTDRTIRELQGPAYSLLNMGEGPSPTPSESDEGSQPVKTPSPVGNKTVRREVLGIKDIPGVGYKISQELKDRFSVETLFELQQIPKEELQTICGMKTGEMLYNSCRGIDETTLASDREKARQSVSAEISWGVRFENQGQVDLFMRDLAQEVSKRLKEIDRKAKSVVMKVMKRKESVNGRWKHMGHGPVDQFARTGQLPMYTDDPELIAKEALNLLRFFKFNVLDIRGLGIQMLKLNNDVVNTVSKSAFTPYDTMNQTTLTSAMFQQKRGSPSKNSVFASVHMNSPAPEPEPAVEYATEAEPPGRPQQEQDEAPPMEIDATTFKELPLEIQEELLRSHRLVFINQPSSTQTGETSRESKAQVGSSLDELTVRKHILPPWSQVDPAELMALSTPVMRDTLKEYAGRRDLSNQYRDSEATGNTILPSPSKAITHPDDIPELDMDFLAALPPEIRAELEAARQLQLVKHRLNLAARSSSSRGRLKDGHDAGLSERMAMDHAGPAALERPTLMGQREIGELRKMLTEWVGSTLLQEDQVTEDSGGCMTVYDEGPNPEDVKSFSGFLARVIFMERDLERVRLLLRWLRRKVEENERRASPVQSYPKHFRVLMTWRQALTSVQDGVQQLVRELYGGTLCID